MFASLILTIATILSCFSNTQAARILLNNDDGWASANIRETFRLLVAAGHDVLMVAPVGDNSGQGGRTIFAEQNVLTADGEFDSVRKGAPAVGHDVDNNRHWYYNGTPAACTFVNLDYVMPQVWTKGEQPDLLVSGPNVGSNLGPFFYTLSGTMGGATAAIGRGIPAIAFSAGLNGGQRGYKEVKSPTRAGLTDPATITATLTATLVQQLIDATPKGERLLPLGYGISVNYPEITSLDNDACLNPPFVLTRMTGGALSVHATLDKAKGTFSRGKIDGPGLNVCLNGDCTLPGETDVVTKGCKSSVTVFTLDYDAPSAAEVAKVAGKLKSALGTGGKRR